MIYRSAFQTHRNLLIVSALYSAAVLGVCLFVDGIQWLRLFVMVLSMYGFYALLYVQIFLGVAFVQACRFDRPQTGSPFKSIRAILLGAEKRFGDFFKDPKFQNGLVGALALALLVPFFCILKSMFTVLTPANWDAYWAQADLLIHGAYPHEYLIPHISAGFELWIEKAYIMWFPVIFAVNTYCVFFDSDLLRRKQYMWSYLLSWMVTGTVLAIVFYSAGPIFYHLVTGGPNPYAGLLSWHQTLNNGNPSFALQAGQFLFDGSKDNIRPDANGPSAMPSQHVAIAWLMMLYAFQVKRWFGILMALFALTILGSSIVLGWHYAVDGYVGAAVVTIIWLAAGYFVRRKAKHEQAG